MAQKLMTPGVYIEEVNAFPGSVVEVATAIPAFIGYTEKASRNGKSLLNKPTRITSLAEYRLLFGGGFSPKFKIEKGKGRQIFTIGDNEYVIKYNDENLLYFFNSIKLFFNNGGGTCYIVSVGTYEKEDSLTIKAEELLGTSVDANGKTIEGGLVTLEKEQEPTMIVIPDAVVLGKECYEVYKQVLAQCAKMQNRVAILDIYNGDEARIVGDSEIDIIANFREKISTEYLNYAAAYYPWLNTNIVQKGDVTFENFDASVDLYELLPKEEVKAKEIVEYYPLDKGSFLKAIINDKRKELQDALKKDKESDVSRIEALAESEKKKQWDEFINTSLNNFRELAETKNVVLAYLKDDAAYKAAIVKEKRPDLENALKKDNKEGFMEAKDADQKAWSLDPLFESPADNTREKTHKVILENGVGDPELIKALLTDKETELKAALEKDKESDFNRLEALAEPEKKKQWDEFIITSLKNLSEETTLGETKKVVLSYLKTADDFKTKLKENKLKELESAIDEDNTKISEVANKILKAATSNFEAFLSNSLKNIGNGDLTEGNKLWLSYKSNKKRNYDLGLIATSPTYVNLVAEITAVMNLLPPSSAMAGIYTTVDNNRGVWKSPANIGLNSVLKPSANITHYDQENLNVDATSGKSINAIRTFPGIGTLVWGARTLDGNSLDWKYINVRRTMIMLEQSIKLALRSYVFEPNDANTWVTVKSMIVNFLTEKWKQGALAGASPDDAFDVQVGLGATMTGLDILEGKMLVTVKLAIVRPAEFIVVTFEQQMQKS